jgi:hypothetical protein
MGFISTWAVTCGAILTLVGVFNTVVDPNRVLGWNSLRPAADSDRELKAYEVMHAAPRTLILGGSRVELGISARHPAWPGPLRPVYNMGMGGATEYPRHRYLQHVLAGRTLELLVMGLDFDSFLDSAQSDASMKPEEESRLTVKRDGSANLEQHGAYVRDLLHSLSLGELKDSVGTVVANLRNDSGGYVSGDVLWSRDDLRKLSAIGALSVFAVSDLYQIKYINNVPHYADTRLDKVMIELRDMLNLCVSHGTQVILIINPVHADLLEIWDSAGLWPAFEDWKRQLTALTYEYSQAHTHSRISLWDFSGYHSYATEAVEPDSRLLKGYFDPSHYTWAVGDGIIQQLFGQGGTGFGIELTPGNIEGHLAVLREERRQYRSRQPVGVERVRLLYSGVFATAKVETARR